MKKSIPNKQILKIFFGFVLTLTILNSKAQTSVYHPFPDSNAVWNVDLTYQGGCYPAPLPLWEHYSYVFNGDTSINIQVYHKLYIPFVNSNCNGIHHAGYRGAIRQDIANKKVYVIPPTDSMEHLLYDFNLKVGDTIPDVVIIIYNSCSSKKVIYAIDSILIGGSFRKEWILNNNEGIIEGIGFTFDLLESSCQAIGSFPYGSLTCFKQNGVTLFPNATTSCNIIDAVNNPSDIKISMSLYPNPASDKIRIVMSNYYLLRKETTLEIHNLIGEKVFQSKITNPKSEIQIDISELNAGIYLITLSDGEKIYRGKLVKN